jgi:DNA-binding NarL/FixJ family response regulator
MPTKHILIIDDHAMFRSGLRMLIDDRMPDTQVAEAGTLRDGLEGMGGTPDVVLLDVKLPGLSGMEGIALVRRQWPEVPVLMLSAQDDTETVQQAMGRGASGFVSKAETAERIVELLNQALRGSIEPPTVGEGASSVRLTPRQCEVLELLCEGLSNKVIARQLTLSENTVRWHVQAILETLQVSSRSEAAFAARRLGLVG